MRIISGTAKGTKLYTLEGLDTRPTLDRVKESVFNIIANEISDTKVLDLFSGSGAIGLEFASRGAKKVYLCDKSKKACEIITKNTQKTHLEEKTKIINNDFIKVIELLQNEEFDIVYLDPPYETDFIKIAICKLKENENLTKDTLIIAETDMEDKILNQIKEMNYLQLVDKRKYGRVNVLFLKKLTERKNK